MNPTYNRYYIFIKPVLKNPMVKTYSPIVFSIITIAIFIVFAIKPTISTIIGLQKTITEQRQILQKLEDKATALSAAKNSYQQLPAKVKAQFGSQIPNSTSVPCIIANIQALARENQASISGLQFQPTPLEGSSECPPAEDNLKNLNKKFVLSEIDITFNAIGSYSNLTGLLYSLNKSSRLIDILSINFNKPQDSNLIMSVNAKAYYLK